MENENIEVAPSEDNGNVPAEAPIEQPATETPTEPAVEPTPTEPELFELPDGRKVEASEVVEEYKNLLSDYTRKSQELAKVSKPGDSNLQDKPTNPLADPEYIPKTYEELARVIQENTLKEIEGRQQAEVQARQALETEVTNQLESLKKTDPNLNENALFLHATKYGFRDLNVAYMNMKDMNLLVKNTQQKTAKDIQKRADPVSITPGATGARPNPSNFQTAVEYMRSLKN